jgi:uncharacterized membrane protein YfcA
MVPPIGLLAALKYYQQGNVKLPLAIFICIGFFVGGLFGAQFAHKLSDPVLKRLFGLFLLGMSLNMIFGK